MKLMKCPACGASIQNQVTSRVVVCEYCDSQFVLDEDMAEAVIEAGAADEYAEYYAQWESMAAFAADACADFLEEMGDDCVSVSKKIYDGLGIDPDEEVYLIHDDSMLGRGKNGFAIAETGLYCREMSEPEGIFLDWLSFAQYDDPYIDGSYIQVNDVSICYYTDNSDFLPDLLNLYVQLQDAARYLAYWDAEE